MKHSALAYLTITAAAFVAGSASAQMAVTIGATDAAACYNHARSAYESSTEPCDNALKDALTTRRDRMKTHVNRGIIHNRNGDLNAAIEDFNAALDIDGDQPEAFINRGNSWFLAGRFDDALEDYERALDAGLNKAWMAWYNIGLAYDQKKQPEKALEAYQKALDLNPDFTKAKNKVQGRAESTRQN